jgi:hypothetical protein
MSEFARSPMRRVRRSRFLQGVAVGVTSCVLLSAGAALAVPSGSGVLAIHACVNKHTFVITERHGASCPAGTSALSWNSAPAPAALPATHPLSDGSALAYASGKLWVGNGKELQIISDATGKVIKTIAEPSDVTHIRVGDGAIWVLLPFSEEILELSESTGAVKQALSAGLELDFPVDIAISGTTAWVANLGDPDNLSDLGSVTEFNASTGALIANFPSDAHFANPAGIAVDAQDIFVENENDTSGVTEMYTNPGFSFVSLFGTGSLGLPAFQGGNIWATQQVDQGFITEYNSALSSTLLSRFIWPTPTGSLTWDGHHWWTCDFNTNAVIEIDATGETMKAYNTSSGIIGPAALAFDGHHIWVLNEQGNLVELPLT